MLIGENSKPRGGASKPSGPAGPVSGRCSGPIRLLPSEARGPSLMRVLTSTSDLPRLEIDARIDPGVSKVGDEVHDKADESENIEIGEDHRIVAVEHAFEAQQAETVERENRLDQKRAGEESGHEGGGEAGDQQRHGG